MQRHFAKMKSSATLYDAELFALLVVLKNYCSFGSLGTFILLQKHLIPLKILPFAR